MSGNERVAKLLQSHDILGEANRAMNFKEPYLLAMADQAPQMLNELRRSGKMDAHLKQKVHEAHQMFDDLTANAPKLPNGAPRDQAAAEASNLVHETLIVFPPDSGPKLTA